MNLFAIPSGIWWVSIVAFLRNISSIILVTFTPLFLKEVMNTSMFFLGFMEGIFEAFALLVRIFSGILSDLFKRRKLFIIIGYGMGAVANAWLIFASTVYTVFWARILDRIGNGVQATARDALVGDLCKPKNRGASFGLRQSLTVGGSACGAVLAYFVAKQSSGDYQSIFLFALFPTLLALFILGIFVHDSPQQSKRTKGDELNPSTLARIITEYKILPPSYWKLLFLSFLTMSGNFGGTFFVFAVQDHGLSKELIPLVMLVKNLFTMFSAFPLGHIADLMGKRYVLSFGILLLAFSSSILGLSTCLWVTMLGVMLWGIQMGVVQSVILALITEICPQHLRGSGVGLIHCVNGVGMLLANSAVGFLWDVYSPSVAFLCSSLIALIAFIFSLTQKFSRKS